MQIKVKAAGAAPAMHRRRTYRFRIYVQGFLLNNASVYAVTQDIAIQSNIQYKVLPLERWDSNMSRHVLSARKFYGDSTKSQYSVLLLSY